MRRRELPKLIALVASTWLVAASAQAAPHSAHLTVSRSETATDCADADVLGVAVNEILGEAAVSKDGDAATDMECRVTVSRDAGGYHATIVTSGTKAGVRDLEDVGQTCTALSNALAVTIAMLLDRSPPKAAPEVVPAPPPPPDPGKPPPREPVSTPWAGFVDVGFMVAPGLLSAIDPGAFVQLRAAFTRRLSLAVGGFILANARADLPPGRVNLGLWSGQLRGCFMALDSSLVRAGMCAEPSVGVLSVEGADFAVNRSASTPWIAVSGDAEVGGPLGSRLSWLARAGVTVPVRRQTIVVDEVGTAWQSSAVSGRFGLALGVKIW